jgi:hypothetical protein
VVNLREKTLRLIRQKFDNNIQVDIKDTGFENVDFIHLAKDTVRLRVKGKV